MYRSGALDVFQVLPGSVQRRVRHRLGRFGPWEQGRAPVPPACPEDLTTGPLDFVGVGVPKCGTTWWFSLIMTHPEIHAQHEKALM